MSTDIDIVCTGDLMVECLLRLPSLPPPNTTVVLDSGRQNLGGAAFNLCWYLSRFERRPRLVGVIGRRKMPLVTEAFSSAQLDNSGLIPIEGDTDLLIAMLTQYHHHSVYLRTLLPDEVGPEILARCGRPSHLILTGSRHALIRRMFVFLAETFRGELLGFNPSYAIYEYDGRELAQLLSKVHVTILSKDEVEHVCKVLDLKDPSQLSNFTPGLLIVTLAERGVRVYHREGILEERSYATAASNAIGAGDAFFAGFLHQTFEGALLSDAVRFGSMLAAYVVESSQVRVHTSEVQIRQRLAEYRGLPGRC